MAKKPPSLAAVSESMNKAVEKFMKKIPKAQRKLLEAITLEIKKLDVSDDGRIKASVKNLARLSAIKSKLNDIILTPEYKNLVSGFTETFSEVTKLTNNYFKFVDDKFKPSSVLKEVRKQAVTDTVNRLTESGIAATVRDQITEVLRSNITTGGKYTGLVSQFKELLTKTGKSSGILERYSRQIVTDSLNQYSAQYNQIVFADLGNEWFSYDGTDIKTTRPFCDSMTDKRIFHITEVPGILKAHDLYYIDKKTGKKTKVELNPKTGLPEGMIPETNADNFFINRGGYNCRHMIRPISQRLVPKATVDKISATPAYKDFKKSTGASSS